MKLYNAFHSVLLLGTVGHVLANFHVGAMGPGSSPENDGCGSGLSGFIACPSNKYGCGCFLNGDGRAIVSIGGASDITTATFFQIKAGLCGHGVLNFYKRSSGHWQFYIAGGDGKSQGTCYSNSAANEFCCNGETQEDRPFYEDRLVCYSNICGS
jgi:hypothetical protein